jgi:putative intracellular protease/amidase
LDHFFNPPNQDNEKQFLKGKNGMKKHLYLFILIAMLLLLVSCSEETPPLPTLPTEQPIQDVATLLPVSSLSPTEETTNTPTSKPSPTANPEPTAWQPKSIDEICELSDTRTCAVLYVLADQYDDEHLIKTRPYFERVGYTTHVTSNTLDVIRGFHECYNFTPAYPELLFDAVEVTHYDVIIFGGSDHWSTVLHENPAAHRIAQDAMAKGIVLAALGDGPVILAKAGVLEGKYVSVMKDVHMYGVTDQWSLAIERQGAIYTKASPVRDGQLITADFASREFAWGILEVLWEQVE